MDRELQKLLEEVIAGQDFDMIISGSTDRELLVKVKVRPVKRKNEIGYQIEEYRGNQVFHRNLDGAELPGQLERYLTGLFRQAEIRTAEERIYVLFSKKGKVTIKRKKQTMEPVFRDLSHNRKKTYLLEEGTPVPFLYELGVMTGDGHVVKAKYDKFRQINRFLEFVDDVYPELEKGAVRRQQAAAAAGSVQEPLTILDFGCGKSYLTFALYHYLKIIKGREVRIIGLDLKKDVVAACGRLAERLGYDGLQFLAGDIADYEGVDRVDMVVTLHACDTATDYALEKAVKWGASVILSVPCCQHELNRQIENEILQPVLKYGLIQERMAALLTDALRGDLLEAAGYQVQLMEFIDMEHTPKNILIRAVKTAKAGNGSGKSGIGRERQKKLAETEACMKFLHVEPTLYRLLDETIHQKETGQE